MTLTENYNAFSPSGSSFLKMLIPTKLWGGAHYAINALRILTLPTFV